MTLSKQVTHCGLRPGFPYYSLITSIAMVLMSANWEHAAQLCTSNLAWLQYKYWLPYIMMTRKLK